MATATKKRKKNAASGGKGPLLSDETTSLGVSLNTDARALNNAAKLLTVLKPPNDAAGGGGGAPSIADDAARRSAIIALEKFFCERLVRGELYVGAAAGGEAGADSGGGAAVGRCKRPRLESACFQRFNLMKIDLLSI